MHTPIMHNAPKRNGPPLPCMARQRSQIWTTRSTSRRTAGSKVVRGQRFLTFIGIAEPKRRKARVHLHDHSTSNGASGGVRGPQAGGWMALSNMLTDRQAIPDGHAQLVGHRGRGPCQWESAAGAPPGWPRSQRQQVPRRWYQSPLLRARDGMLATPGGTSSSKRGWAGCR